MGDAIPARLARRRLRRNLRQGAAHGVRRDRRPAPDSSASARAGVRAPGNRTDARSLHPALSRRLVPAGRRLHRMKEFLPQAERLPGALPAWHTTNADLRSVAEKARAQKARLVALWASDERTSFALHVASGLRAGLLWLTVPLEREHPRYPSIADLYPVANRMQRAAHDLLGVLPQGGADHRKWLRHGAWPAGAFPLRKDFDPATRFETVTDQYPFVRVDGEGVHEIPVGPVHAGTIEPGHFRFSIVVETILRLEERLGYKHKGIEKRFEALGPQEGARLAGRVSGDSTVAYAWAYAMALEAAAGVEPPPRASPLRGIALELERATNHLGDLGYQIGR